MRSKQTFRFLLLLPLFDRLLDFFAQYGGFLLLLRLFREGIIRKSLFIVVIGHSFALCFRFLFRTLLVDGNNAIFFLICALDSCDPNWAAFEA